MNFGKLNKRVEIQQYTKSRTESGSFNKTWAKLKDCNAQMIYKTGSVNIEANQEQATNRVEFIIRKCNEIDVNEKQRILYNSEYFYIEYVNLIGRDMYMRLITERKTINHLK